MKIERIGANCEDDQPYPQGTAIALGYLDLTFARQNALVRFAHLVLAYQPGNQNAKKLVAQYENGHPLQEALAKKLFGQWGITGFWATTPIQGQQPGSRVVRIAIENARSEVLSFNKRALFINNRVDRF